MATKTGKAVKDWDREPTTAEQLNATISCMGGNRIWPSTECAFRIVLEQLERGRAYNPAAVALLRKRLEKGGRIVKPKALLSDTDSSAWITTLRAETATPGRRAQVALLTAMEMENEAARRIALMLRLYMGGLLRVA